MKTTDHSELHDKPKDGLKKTEGLSGRLAKLIQGLPHHDLVHIHRIASEELEQRAEKAAKNKPLHEMSDREFQRHLEGMMQDAS